MVKRFTSHTLMALAEASLVAMLVVGLVAGTAFAAKGGGGKPGGGATAALSCSINPNPVAVGSQYAISGSGYPTGTQLLIDISNAHGTVTLFAGATPDGQLAATSYASWAEAHTVKVFNNAGRRPALLSTCGFTAS